jgi:hypothetical protein
MPQAYMPRARGRPSGSVNGQYRPLNAAQRADHIEALILLARLVIASPPPKPIRRTFVVMEAITP